MPWGDQDWDDQESPSPSSKEESRAVTASMWRLFGWGVILMLLWMSAPLIPSIAEAAGITDLAYVIPAPHHPNQ